MTREWGEAIRSPQLPPAKTQKKQGGSASRRTHPEASLLASDDGEQGGHGFDDAVHLAVDVVRADLSGEAGGPILRAPAAVLGAHVHRVQQPGCQLLRRAQALALLVLAYTQRIRFHSAVTCLACMM